MKWKLTQGKSIYSGSGILDSGLSFPGSHNGMGFAEGKKKKE